MSLSNTSTVTTKEGVKVPLIIKETNGKFKKVSFLPTYQSRSLYERIMCHLTSKLSEYSEISGSTMHTSFAYCFMVIMICLIAVYVLNGAYAIYGFTKTFVTVLLGIVLVVIIQLYECTVYVCSLCYLLKTMCKLVLRKR